MNRDSGRRIIQVGCADSSCDVEDIDPDSLLDISCTRVLAPSG